MDNKKGGMIHVGKVKSSGRIFIAVPEHMTERLKTPLTKEPVVTVDFSEDDTEWLVMALLKELKRDRILEVIEEVLSLIDADEFLAEESSDL